MPCPTCDGCEARAARLRYLNAALDEAGGNPAFIAQVLGDIARSHGMERVARETGMTRQDLYKALSADGNPELSTLLKVLRALGMKLHAQAA